MIAMQHLCTYINIMHLYIILDSWQHSKMAAPRARTSLDCFFTKLLINDLVFIKNSRVFLNVLYLLRYLRILTFHLCGCPSRVTRIAYLLARAKTYFRFSCCLFFESFSKSDWPFPVGGRWHSEGWPCSPQETGGTLQWGGSNRRNYDR